MPDNKEIVIQFQLEVAKNLKGELSNQGDYLADEVIWHLPESLGELCDGSQKVGKVAVLEMIENLVARFYKTESMQFTFHSMIAEAPFVHIHFTLGAETVNGKTYQSGYQTLYQFREGKISEVWEYFDSGKLITLLGQR